MAYQVQITESAGKTIEKLPRKIQQQIIEKLSSLQINPRPGGCKKLKGIKDLYRIRSGDYRVVYKIKDKILLVIVVRIGIRKDVYKGLE